VIRTPDAYAATDGRGTLAIGAASTLDADDSLAQMIFHELCHSLVEGPDSFAQPDWGMDNTGPDHDWREHACLRVQALLAGRYGLRALLAPTTEHRAFYDALGPDPLADAKSVACLTSEVRLRLPRRGASSRISPQRAGRAAEGRADFVQRAILSAALCGPLRCKEDPAVTSTPRSAPESIRLARAGAVRAERAPWAPHLLDALEATSAIVIAAIPYAAPGSLFERGTPRPALHPSGLPAAPVAGHTCSDCAWKREVRGRSRCVQASARIDPSWPACERFEPALDCQSCAACCREAYGVVELSRRDPFVRAHPELIEKVDGRIVLLRRDGRCPALDGDGPYACRCYEDRPRTCRDFERGSDNCLEARRRVGLSL
jgi:hypothetical protein